MTDANDTEQTPEEPLEHELVAEARAETWQDLADAAKAREQAEWDENQAGPRSERLPVTFNGMSEVANGAAAGALRALVDDYGVDMAAAAESVGGAQVVIPGTGGHTDRFITGARMAVTNEGTLLLLLDTKPATFFAEGAKDLT